MNKQSNPKKLWSDREDHDKLIESFTIGHDRDLDLLLAPYDILGSLAHGKMLSSVDILADEEWKNLRAELVRLYRLAETDQFRIEEGVEDVHSQVELILIQRIGEQAKKIHTGRSRNDQVMLDIRLFTRDRIKSLVKNIGDFFDLLLSLSEQHKQVLLPGYTHFQVAMPSSFGLWFAAYAESLTDDLLQMLTAFHIVNKNPLGSAAGYGSSFPIDRKMTTHLLGFEDLNYNAVYAQMGRGRTERIVSQALGSLAETLGRLAMDIVWFLSQNMNFISFPESVTTGSSIMPHKKNPDVFEIIRAKCNRIKNLPSMINIISANLPSGYHRDFQEIKEPYLQSFDELLDCIGILIHVLPEIIVNEDILNNQIYENLFSVERVNEKVMQGLSFREAYHAVSTEIKLGKSSRPKGITYTHEGSIGNLCNDKIERRMQTVLKQFSFERIDQACEKLLSKS